LHRGFRNDAYGLAGVEPVAAIASAYTLEPPLRHGDDYSASNLETLV
jgi:hypothetical protein